MVKLQHIATLLSGIYAQSNASADTLYLQGVHFNEFGVFDRNVLPQLKSDSKIERHLLKQDDILFAAKGLHNFAVVYEADMGNAVASSSFIVVRLNGDYKNNILPSYLAWFLTHTPGVKLFHKKQLGTTIPSISIEKLNQLEVEIPALEQQHKIINIQQLRNQEKQLVHRLQEQKDYLIKQTLLNATKAYGL